MFLRTSRRCCSGQPPVAKGRSHSTSFQLLRELALHMLRSFSGRFSKTDSFTFSSKIRFLGFVFSPLPLQLGGEGSFGTTNARLVCCCLYPLPWPHGPETGICILSSVFLRTIQGTSSAFVGEGLTVCLCIS